MKPKKGADVGQVSYETVAIFSIGAVATNEAAETG
jgi:hypothetical protein